MKTTLTLHKLPQGFIVTSDEKTKYGDYVWNGEHILGVAKVFHPDGQKVIAKQDQIDFSALSDEAFELMSNRISDRRITVTEKDIKPLQDLVNDGYDPYDTCHHLQVKRMLNVIETFIQSLNQKSWEIEGEWVDGKFQIQIVK